MSGRPTEMYSMYDWLLHTDAEEARRASAVCECGSEATYKDKKGFDTTYFHSWWCPKYKDKEDIKDDGKQEEK